MSRLYLDDLPAFSGEKKQTAARKVKKARKKTVAKRKHDNFSISSLKIEKIDSSKDRVQQPPLAEVDVIPRLGTMSIFNGMTGSGKSNLINNFLSRPEFYDSPGVFDTRILISPTANADDMQKSLHFDLIYSDLKEAEHAVSLAAKEQRKKVEEMGNDKAGNLLIYADDIISDKKFINSKAFTQGAIASRHDNITFFTSSQSWTGVPRKVRLQAKNIFFFASSQSEVDLLHYEYCPPGMTKSQFYAMITYATSEPFSFLYINKSVPMEKRFRKNLDEIISLDYFKTQNEQFQKHAGSRPSNRGGSETRRDEAIDFEGTERIIEGGARKKKKTLAGTSEYRASEDDQRTY